MYRITMPMQKFKHSPDNIGGVITFVVFLMALHDKFGFGRNRFHMIFQKFMTDLDETVNKGGFKQLHEVQRKLEADGWSEKYMESFIHWMPRILERDDTYRTILKREPIQCKKDRLQMAETTEIAYILLFNILTTEFKFKKIRINKCQEAMRTYQLCLYSQNAKIVELMECLHCECALDYGALDEYKRIKPVNIYG